jgi:hypothetical protein
MVPSHFSLVKWYLVASNESSGLSGSLRRRGPRRSGDLVLVVCEGRKTEPEYFRETQKRWKIQRLKIAPVSDRSSPKDVVERAVIWREKFEKEMRVEFDQVWCVFDHDEHETFEVALNEAAKEKIQVAYSIPCFEFWYLLHFEYTTRPFRDFSEVESQLKQYMKPYKKASADVASFLPHVEKAIENARRVREELQKTGAERPVTHVDKLVDVLIHDPIKRKKR